MQSMEEDAPKGEVRKGNAVDCKPEQRNPHSQHTGWGKRCCRRQGGLQFSRDTSGGSPSSGDGSSNWGSDWSSWHSTVMRVSGESNWPAQPGRGLRMKVNLPNFKDEKTKDTVTYHLLQWNIAVFCCSGWDDQYLLPYVIWSLQGFPGVLARRLGKDPTWLMSSRHWMTIMAWWWHSMPWGRRCILSSKDQWRTWLNLECLSQQALILQSEYPGRIQQEHMEEMK